MLDLLPENMVMKKTVSYVGEQVELKLAIVVVKGTKWRLSYMYISEEKQLCQMVYSINGHNIECDDVSFVLFPYLYSIVETDENQILCWSRKEEERRLRLKRERHGN